VKLRAHGPSRLVKAAEVHRRFPKLGEIEPFCVLFLQQRTPRTRSRALSRGKAKRREYSQDDNVFTVNTQIIISGAGNQGQCYISQAVKC
jgi:hypothetical protein